MLIFSCLMTSYGCGNMIRLSINEYLLFGIFLHSNNYKNVAMMSVSLRHLTHSYVFSLSVVQEA